MTRVQLTENFYLDEFIDPATYAKFGSRSISFIDIRLVEGIQFMRNHMGSLTVNNWATGGQYKLSGLRPFDTKIGAKWSQHKYKCAADVKSSKYSPAELFAFLREHEELYIKNQWVTTVENIKATPTWLHCDNRFTGQDSFLIVNP